LGSSGPRASGRDYNEWFDDRDNFFKMNVAGPSRAKWLKGSRSRTLSDLVDRNTGDLIDLEDLPGSTPVVSRREYIDEFGSTSEKERM
jgi:hypothetical protein